MEGRKKRTTFPYMRRDMVFQVTREEGVGKPDDGGVGT